MTAPARFRLSLFLPDADATAAFARRMAPLLAGGHTILLEGPIGAGKSHFARALIQARLAAVGRAEDVPSPTFTLVQVYEAGGEEIWHADLYRLTDPGEALELGLDEAFEKAICLVEWPERLGAWRPASAAALRLVPDRTGEARQAEMTADDSRWAGVFAGLGSHEQ